MTPMPAAQVLDQYFLEARARLLDLAAILDRIHRGAGADRLDDPRDKRLQAAIKLLAEFHPNHAESMQDLFSVPYDPKWIPPVPRY